jgi:hemerythrin-like domain-containing protein
MPQRTPNLLADDGSASIATGVMMSHHGMRRDLARFAIALRRVKDGDHSRVQALQEEWKSFHGTLHGHHEAEDNGLFPGTRSQHPALAPIVDKLTADHRQIDPLLEQGDRAFAGLPGTAADAAQVVSRLSALLDPHLGTEEEHVIPLFRSIKAFPAFSDSELDMFAQGFAWASHGIAPEVLEQSALQFGDAAVVPARVRCGQRSYRFRSTRSWLRGVAPTGVALRRPWVRGDRVQG